MSGIYIPMEMPKSCGKCGWYSFIEEVCRVNRRDIPTTDNVYMERHKDCPLIPVPNHGRLIDADALGVRDAEKQAYEALQKEKGEFFAEETILEYLRGRCDGLIHASGLVRFAPTIIPASKEGEG